MTLALARRRPWSRARSSCGRGGDHFHRRPRAARRVAGPWDEALSEVVGEPVRLVAPPHGGADRGRGGAATLLGQASLEAIARVLGVSTGRSAAVSHELRDRRPRAARRRLVDRPAGAESATRSSCVQGNVGRCAITTQNPETGLPDLDTLKALAGLPRRASRRPSRCRSASTPPSPSRAACASATRIRPL